MKSGGGLRDAIAVAVDADDSEDSDAEDTVPISGLRTASGSSAKWGKFGMVDDERGWWW